MDFRKSFEEIRKDRMGVVNSSVYPGLKTLVSQIYPDEAHFIYELLQNAEDAGATEVEFVIKKTKLVFSHNGTRFFDVDDINAITNIAHSTKKDNYVQAGKFGIGFKSVYAFTETPSIYCDSISFKIEKLLLPTEIEPLKGKKKGWTEFHFPFDSPKIAADEAKRKIKQGLLEIENTTLLFLNNIASIKYKLEDGSESCVKKHVDGNVISSAVYVTGKQKSKSTWKRFSRTTTLHGKKITVDLAFPMDYGKDSELKFVQGQDKVCITFLAKNEKSNLKFFVNAPFGCTPARDTINKDDKDNKVLIEELAKLVKTALEELKQENMLTDEFFNILPIEDDNIPDFYRPLVEAFCSAFRDKSYLPTVNNTYVTVGNGIMSSKSVIDKTFTIEDIQYLYNNKNLQFVKNRPVNSRAYKFLKMLEIEELTPESILAQFVEISESYLMKWLEELNTKHLSEVYAYLYKGVVEIQRDIERYDGYSYYDDPYYVRQEYYKEEYNYAQLYKIAYQKMSNIQKLHLVKAEDGKFYLPEDTRILAKKIDVPEEYRLVDKNLLGKQEATSFLKAIGVKEFTEKELEQYMYTQETNEFMSKINDISGNEDPLGIARLILKFLEEHSLSEVNLSEKKIVCSNKFQGGGNNRRSLYVKAQEVYLDAPYIKETGFRFVEDIHKKKGISDVYSNLTKDELTRWIDLLIQLGCYYSLKVERKSYSTGYVTGYHYDYEVHHLSQYLAKKNVAINRYIWRFFTAEGGWSYSYARESRKTNKNWGTHYDDSTLLKAVKNNAWIVDKNGKFCTPSKVSEGTIADDWERVDEDNGFLSAIGFGAEQHKRDEELRHKEELERLQQESKQEAAETLGFSSAEDVVAAKESSRKIEELKELGIDVDELISSKRKERDRKKYTLQEQMQQLKQNEFVANEIYDDGEVYRIPNPERRSSKIKEEISAEKAPAKKTTVTKRTEVNKEEKHFVGTEYSGRCQICDKIIYKKDGTRHFVAMNMFDTGHLEEKYLNGLSTGWNTLCFCPNCAAEYKYGAVSMYDFIETVKETEITKTYSDYYKFEIQMQGEKRVLRYTPRHLLSLKTALEFFEQNKEADRVEEITVTNGNKQSVIEEENVIDVIAAGDRCPVCGVSNVRSQTIKMLDYNGVMQSFSAIVCGCGKKYLTKRLKNKLPISVQWRSVEGFAPLQNTPKKKKTATVVAKKTKNSSLNSRSVKCPFCGMPNGLFADKGMCWSCYKDMMSSRYEE